MRAFFWTIPFFFVFNVAKTQEISTVDKVKIGKYIYNLYLSEFYAYEDDLYGISYSISRKGKEQNIGTFLVYRTLIRDKSDPIEKEHPPNRFLKFKELEVKGEGSIHIENEQGRIINKFVTYRKDYEFEADSSVHVFQQGKRGFFQRIETIEYRNGMGKTVLKNNK